jgi:hypothetical protein
MPRGELLRAPCNRCYCPICINQPVISGRGVHDPLRGDDRIFPLGSNRTTRTRSRRHGRYLRYVFWRRHAHPKGYARPLPPEFHRRTEMIRLTVRSARIPNRRSTSAIRRNWFSPMDRSPRLFLMAPYSARAQGRGPPTDGAARRSQSIS